MKACTLGHTLATVLFATIFGSAAVAHAEDRLFVADYLNLIRLDLDTDLATTVSTSAGGLGGACSPDGLLYFIAYDIERWDQNGGNYALFPIPGSPKLLPSGLAFDSSGNLWFNTLTRGGPQPPAGAWRIKDADPAAPPEQVIAPFADDGYDLEIIKGGPHAGALLLTANGWRESIVYISEPPGAPLRKFIDLSASSSLLIALATNECGEIFLGTCSGVGLGCPTDRFDPEGRYVKRFLPGNPGTGSSLDIDSAGNIYGTNGRELWRITPDGTSTLLLQSKSVQGFIGFAICRDAPLACAQSGPYRAECSGSSTCVNLGVTNSLPCDQHEWTSDCPGTDFGGTEHSATPRLCVDSSDCSTRCNTTLTLRRGSRTASCTSEVLVEDTTVPRLLGIPADARVECDAVPVATGILGEDDCDPLPALVADEKRADGACLFSYDLKRSWTVTDRCGLSADAAQQIEVRDTTAPLIAGVPPSTIVECDSVPPVAPALASDNCDPTPALAFAESRAPGSCPQNFILTREWLARDVCGNKTPATQTIDARDRTGPAISGVPPGATVACNAVPPPASPVAGDNCDPAPRLVFAEDRTDGSCPGNYSLKRTWTANDQCANSTFATQVVTVQDLTPPVIAGGNHEQYCLWPPNHRYVCFDRGDFAPLVSDDCSEPLTWRLAGCRSNQPDDADESDRGGPWSGDGRTRDDCTVSRDGERICVRAERAGSGPGAAAGRQYDVTIIATDACGNESAAVSIGHIRVPHDRRATDDRCR